MKQNVDEEDCSKISEETKRSIARAEKDIAEGRVYTFESIKKEFRLCGAHEFME